MRSGAERCGARRGGAVPEPALRERSGQAPRPRPSQALYSDWGCRRVSSVPSLVEDWTPLSGGGRSKSNVERRAERALEEGAGAWPEELDIGVYADTSMTLPGYGDRGKGCGEWAPREFCDTCGEVHLGPHRCHQRGCPDCWSSWAARRAESITRRIQSARWVLEDGIERRVVHAVASPPTGEVTSLADVGRYRTRAIERAGEAGIRGGVTVFHGFRVRQEVKEEYRGEDPDVSLWRWVREHPKGWRSLTYWSPHYHIIGLATEVEPEESDEWVVSRLSTLDPMRALRDEASYEAVAKVSQYFLSHATFEPGEGGSGVKAVTWYGDLHSSNFSPDPIDAAQRKTEPKLEAPSEGAYAVIQRLSAEATRSDGTEKRGAGIEAPECEEEGCTGHLREIWDAGRYLSDHRFCEKLSRDRERRLRTAWEWRVGDRAPPPGLKRPRTEAEAEEALEALL